MKWVIDDQDQTELPDLVQRPAAPSSSSQPRNYVAIQPKTEIQSYLETFRAGDPALCPSTSTSSHNK